MVLRHAAPPVTVWIDNSSVAEGFRKGRRWCLSSRRPAVDLWLMVWSKVSDLGDDCIVVAKVKGHATTADVDNGLLTALQQAGNDHADHFAKQGSELADHLSSTARWRVADRTAKQWYSWLAVLVANWPADTQRRIVPTTGCKRSRHPPVQSASPAALPTAALGAKAARIDISELGKGHRLYRSGELLWCCTCGAYAALRLKSLKEPCGGDAGRGPRAGQLARMLKGEHPIRRGERLQTPVRVTG